MISLNLTTECIKICRSMLNKNQQRMGRGKLMDF